MLGQPVPQAQQAPPPQAQQPAPPPPLSSQALSAPWETAPWDTATPAAPQPAPSVPAPSMPAPSEPVPGSPAPMLPAASPLPEPEPMPAPPGPGMSGRRGDPAPPAPPQPLTPAAEPAASAAMLAPTGASSLLRHLPAAVRGRRAARKPRLAMSAVFADLVDMADIPRSAYAVDEEVTGAMCLFKTDGGYEVFSCAEDARHEVRFFEDEEAAYFYLFGVLAAEAVRQRPAEPAPWLTCYQRRCRKTLPKTYVVACKGPLRLKCYRRRG